MIVVSGALTYRAISMLVDRVTKYHSGD
jgi:hypothetical protein